MTKLSVNVNKIALLRNTRDYGVPDVVRAARTCIDAADSVGEEDRDGRGAIAFLGTPWGQQNLQNLQNLQRGQRGDERKNLSNLRRDLYCRFPKSHSE